MWTKATPVAPGWYWFRGYRSPFHKANRLSEKIPVYVLVCGDRVHYRYDGQYYPEWGFEGSWKPVEDPGEP